jgi:transcriptional/translational regulatory protein YebC/TACO1
MGDGDENPGSHQIWVSIDSLHEVARELEKTLGEAEGVKLAWKPTLTVEVDADTVGTLMKLVDTLEEDDDVQTVWGNYEISDDVMETLS